MRILSATILILVMLIASSTATIYFAQTQTTNSTATPDPTTAPPAQNVWNTMNSMHVPRAYLGAATVNGKIYAIGGEDQAGFWTYSMGLEVYSGGVVGANEQYDPTANSWTEKTPMPTPRSNFAIAASQNKIFCIGGATSLNPYTGATLSSVNEAYNPETNSWETKAPLPVAESYLQANVVNGKIYVLTYMGKNFVYDPSINTWTNKTQAPNGAFDGYSSAVLDGKIYVIGGLTADGHANYLQIYDPQTDKWSIGSSPPSSLGSAFKSGAAAATTGQFSLKRIYGLGQNGNLRQGEPTGTNRIYNPQTDAWDFGANMPIDRIDFAAAAFNDTIYVIGGGTSTSWFVGNYSPSAVCEQYLPLGYGTTDPTYQTPAPTPTATTALTPTATPVFGPTPTPALSVSLAESASALNYGNKINFTVTAEGGTAPYTYSWFVDSQLAENGSSPYYSTISQAVGSHHVYVLVKDAVGVYAQTLTVAFEVLPNPPGSPSSSTSQTPSPTVPEFPFWTLLLVGSLVAVLTALASKRKK